MKTPGTKILAIAVVLLLLTNISLVALMVFNKGKHGNRYPPRGDRMEMMMKDLSMTPEQQQQFKSMKEEHFSAVRPLFDSIRQEKTTAIDLLKKEDAADSLMLIYSTRISQLQSHIDRMTFEHFRKLRKIFTVDQQPRFDEMLKKMMQRGRRDSSGKK